MKKKRVPPPSAWQPKIQIVPAVVDDPYEPGQRIVAMVNVREHPLGRLRAAGRVDAAQYAAGDKFRRLYEQLMIGRQRSIDYTNPVVDGGGKGDPLTDAVVAAGRELARARTALGANGYSLARAICGEGLTLEAVASTRVGRGLSMRARTAYVSGRLCECLDELVGLWGMMATGSGYRPRTTSDTTTGPVTLLTVGRFGEIHAEKVEPGA